MSDGATVDFGAALFRAGDPFSALVRARCTHRLAAHVMWTVSGKAIPESKVIGAREERGEGELELTLEATLPLLPTTYDGKAIKIAWVVRVDVDGEGPRDFPFRVE